MYIGEKEDQEGMLRSILAQLEFSYQICKWDDAGTPFRTYMYVPEKHPLTGSEFHEREDFAHVLKVHMCTSQIGFGSYMYVVLLSYTI